ncbi:MAG: SDR family NAD(P)-dependent oxidoreductase [Streptosporangiaceae bacterium]
MTVAGGQAGLLAGRQAVIYGGGGTIGGAVARAFAAHGAAVHLAGRTSGPLDRVATGIRAAGGTAATAVLDALDERAVDEHADAVATAAGRLDISVNLISHQVKQGTPLTGMTAEDVARPVRIALRSTFLTSRAAARHMTRQRSGVILMFGGYGDPVPGVGGLQIAFGAVEALRRALACELGPSGIRVLTLQTGGIPESLPADFPGRQALADGIGNRTMLRRAATLADVGNAAVLAASELARSMTATQLNITCGAMVD